MYIVRSYLARGNHDDKTLYADHERGVTNVRTGGVHRNV